MKRSSWILGLLLLVSFGLRAYLVLRPFPYVDSLLLCDDAYLSLTVARTWAQGMPMSYDGLSHTNGFQPLYVFLTIPFFLLFPHDLIRPIQAALVLLSLANAATAWLIYRVLAERTRIGALFAAWLWAFSPPVIAQGLNGLETGLAVVLMASASLVYLRFVRGKPEVKPWSVGLTGLLIGLAILARMDQVLFLLAVLLDFLFSRRRMGWPWMRIALGAGLLILSSLVTFSPWLILSPHYTGSIVPVSGKAVRFLTLADADMRPALGFYLKMAKSALLAAGGFPLPITPWIASLGRALGPYKAFGYGLILLSASSALLATRKSAFWDQIRPFRSLLWFSLFLIAFYAGYIFTHWYHLRYLFPAAYLLTLFWGALLGWIWGKASPSAVRTILVVLSFGGSLLAFLPGLVRLAAAQPREANHYRFACWVRDSLPKGATVGIFQSGAAGYFRGERRIVNLDGVVNAEALRAAQERRLWSYVQKERIEYLLDWEQSFQKVLRPFAGKPLSEEDLKLYRVLPEGHGGDIPIVIYRAGKGSP